MTVLLLAGPITICYIRSRQATTGILYASRCGWFYLHLIVGAALIRSVCVKNYGKKAGVCNGYIVALG